ncbi:hypothetical protein PoB_001961500 [Plakobranchus ocellatus]|uniref:Uncharacterized protein n=1 Tax=Plakobranchus ocellatus TaxID=259542 RepID=A0AAV3ZBZ0_9GAST|nr:hypothetical protein PoB_001961500 [Plakobranchus ocellatus]
MRKGKRSNSESERKRAGAREKVKETKGGGHEAPECPLGWQQVYLIEDAKTLSETQGKSKEKTRRDLRRGDLTHPQSHKRGREMGRKTLTGQEAERPYTSAVTQTRTGDREENTYRTRGGATLHIRSHTNEDERWGGKHLQDKRRSDLTHPQSHKRGREMGRKTLTGQEAGHPYRAAVTQTRRETGRKTLTGQEAERDN